MGKTDIHDSTMVQDSNGSVKEVVATDPYAVGFISLGVVDAKVKALSVDGSAPKVENIKVGKYRMVRPFLYLRWESRKGPPVSSLRTRSQRTVSRY